jgi:hypothetical protein
VLAASSASAAELASGLGWHTLPNTKILSVCAGANGFSSILGNLGCEGITEAWSGGVFDTKRNRMIIFGGGHNDYYGNEVYAISLDTQSIQRLTDPGPKAPGSPCSTSVANGTQANSRHTYDGIEYMPNVDKMFVFGGSLACSSGNFGNDTWTFSFATNTWQRMNPSVVPWGDAGVMTAYDPNTGLVFLHDRKALYSYDVAADKFTKLSPGEVTLGYTLAATIDPKRKKFVIMGHDTVQGAGRMYVYDIAPGSSYTMSSLSTTGGSAVVSEAYPGMEYDPVTDRIVAWDPSAPNNVYSLNMDTKAWSTATYSGGPAAAGNGTHGRFRYSPKSGVFVLVNRVGSDAVFLRHSTATVVKPNAPTNVSAQ